MVEAFQTGDRVLFTTYAGGRAVAVIRGTVQFDPLTRPERPGKKHDQSCVDVMLDVTGSVYSVQRDRLNRLELAKEGLK